jgi:hypothetical protein
MARANQRDPRTDDVQAYLDGVAKNLVDKLYGPDGPPWGTTLTQIEDLILDIRQRLTKAMIEQALARQATTTADQRPPAYGTCPGCQQPLACDDTNPRIVQTRVGEAEWSEPQAYCPRCRRAFFPSVEEPGPRPR